MHPKAPTSDRERILLTISGIASACWSPLDHHHLPPPGGIVRAVSSALAYPEPHRWAVARVVRWNGPGAAVLRAIGGSDSDVCALSNEVFEVLSGVPEWRLLEGRAWEAVAQVHRAFALFESTPGRNRYDCIFRDASVVPAVLADDPIAPTTVPDAILRILVRPHALCSSQRTCETYAVEIPIVPEIPDPAAIAQRVWDACPWHTPAPTADAP